MMMVYGDQDQYDVFDVEAGSIEVEEESSNIDRHDVMMTMMIVDHDDGSFDGR